MKTLTKSKSAAATATAEERRRERRARIALSARVRPSDPQGGDFEEICVTINASRGGLYFLTDRLDYKKGMRLFVNFPYTPQMGDFTSTFLAEIVRVERKSGGKIGVALHTLGGVNLKSIPDGKGLSRK